MVHQCGVGAVTFAVGWFNGSLPAMVKSPEKSRDDDGKVDLEFQGMYLIAFFPCKQTAKTFCDRIFAQQFAFTSLILRSKSTKWS